ncbi:hypothetical protein L4D06_08140 [Enterovibrio makurazakiensis]|uniref:hypothetical protein n=1 Tax=Enterovibrio makurazakiensis TaxID=2910232 RepID=UPI003D1DF15E
MIDKFESVCVELKARYMKILSLYYPAHGSTGFTERNLTNNFVSAFEKILGESCISWFEAPICLNDGKHLDAVLFFESTTILIEAKRLTSVNSQLVSIEKDIERMCSPKTIELVEKKLRLQKGDRTRYAIVLCDVWTENNQKEAAFRSWPEQLPENYLADLVFNKKMSFNDLDVEGDWKNNYKIMIATCKVGSAKSALSPS